MKRVKKYFTFAELLPIAGCMVLLVAMLSSGCFLQSARENSRRKSCISNLKMISVALFQYQDTNNEKCPNGDMAVTKPGESSVTKYTYTRDVAGVNAVYNVLRFGEYLSDGNVFVCASSTASGEKDTKEEMEIKATDGTLSYAYSYVEGSYSSGSAVAGDLTHIDSADKNANHTNYGNLLFADGHVTGYNGAGWCSDQNTGYTELSDSGMTKYTALPPNTLRNAATGK